MEILVFHESYSSCFWNTDSWWIEPEKLLCFSRCSCLGNWFGLSTTPSPHQPYTTLLNICSDGAEVFPQVRIVKLFFRLRNVSEIKKEKINWIHSSSGWHENRNGKLISGFFWHSSISFHFPNRFISSQIDRFYFHPTKHRRDNVADNCICIIISWCLMPKDGIIRIQMASPKGVSQNSQPLFLLGYFLWSLNRRVKFVRRLTTHSLYL